MRSIRWRLALAFAVTSLVTVAAIGGLALGLIRSMAERRVATATLASAESVAAALQPLLEQGPREPELANLVTASAFLGARRVRVLDVDGAVLADSGPMGDGLSVWHPGMTRHTRFALPGDAERGPRRTSATPPGMVLVGGDGRVAIRILRQGSPLGGPRFAVELVDTATPVVGAEPARGAESGSGTRGASRPHPRAADEQALRVAVGDADAPLGFVELSGASALVDGYVDTARRAILAAAVAATALAATLGVAFSRSLTRPLDDLGAAARRMGQGDLAARAPVSGSGELADLATSFNAMAEGLERTVATLEDERDALRRFVADASHQLRTPITALATNLSLLGSAARDDEEARVGFLADSTVQVDQLTWITRNLLDLSRLDAGIAALEMDDVDARDLATSTARSFAARAREAGLLIETHVPETPVRLYCDAHWVTLALSNLVDNALGYAPEGSAVVISAARSVPEPGTTAASAIEGVALSVRDAGPGVAPEDRALLFDRFSQGRIPPARGRTGGREGAGLGLAIVRSVALVHGGRVSVSSTPGGGATFTLLFPGRAP